MSMIHINRDRQNLGQFSPEEVAEGLRSNRFLPTDLAWRDGMDGWQPLSTFADLPVPEEAAPPALAPETEAVVPPLAPQGPPKPEWERHEEVGFARAWLITVRQVFTEPVATFRDMTKTGGFQWPFVYCYVTSFVCALIGILESLVWARVLPRHLLPAAYSDDTVHTQLIFTVPALLVIGLLVPFAFSGIYFLMVKMLTKKSVPYETVFRAYCYAAGTLSLVNLLPIPPIQTVQFAFLFFVSIIAVTYQVIAVREALGLTTGEALGVVLVPMVLCCFCGIALVGGAMALAGSVPGLQNLGH